MHLRSFLRSALLTLVALAFLAPGVASGQTQTYSVLIDTDNSDATGCTVGTPPEAFLGADYELVATVDTAVDPPQVTGLALNVCTVAPGTWAPYAGPNPFTELTPPWPAPTELGLDAIESYLPLSILSVGPVVQLGFFSGDIAAPEDVLFTTDGSPTGPAIVFGIPIAEIPTLAEWSMLLLALLLLATGVVALRRRASRAGLMLGLLLISGGLGIAVATSPHAADGNILDWTSHTPIANDALPPDAGVNADIGRAFAHLEGGGFFFRHDGNNTPNGPPQAVDDTATVLEDSGATVIDVLANDQDPPPADVFTIDSASDPAHGTVVVAPDGLSLTYQPDPNYCNTPPGTTLDTFTYTLTPAPSTATVTVTVTCVNDAPAGTDGAVTTPEDTAHVFAAADFGFTDPNDTPPNALLAVTITTLPGAGSLTLSAVPVSAGQSIAVADISAGNLEFTPAAGANGTPYTSFTFQVQDDGGTANGGVDLDPTPNTLTINVASVNSAPAGTDNTVSTNEDIAYVFATADFGFTDPNDTPPNALQAVTITTLPGAGSLTLSSNPVVAGQSIPAADIGAGNLEFTPAANANGTPYTTFTFQVQDDGGTAGGGVDLDPTPNTMTIDVTAVNDAPAGTDNTVATNEDVPYVFATADFGFTDPNDTPANALQAVTITTLPGAGSLTLSSNPVVAGQSVAVADISGGNLEFTPAAGANGTPYTSFTFQVQDDGGTANGGIDLDPTPNTMTIDVTGVNSAPAGTDNTVATNEDVSYVFATADFGFTDPNDSPPNALLAVTITTLPGAGSLTLSAVPVSAGQSIPVADITGGNLSFTPAAGASGTPYASFTFQVQDDGGTANGGVDLDPTPNTMTINVNTVNDAPAGTDNTVGTNEDVPYVFATADFGFTDPNDTPANALQAVTITTLPGAGSLTLSSNPVVAGQSIAVADISGGNLEFTPAAGASGTPYASFTFQVQDDGGAANGGVDLDPTPNTMTINVAAVNDAPSGADNTVATNEDVPYVFATADFGFTDPNDSPPNALLAVTITTLPGAGSLTLSAVPVSAGQSVPVASITGGSLEFTPAAGASGTPYASFTFQVQDDGGTANGGVDLDPTPNTMTINVNAVNDAPAGADNTVATDEDVPYTFAAADFGFTDPNDSPPNAFLAVTIATLPGAGSLTLSAVPVSAGQSIPVASIPNLVFTPASNASGTPYASFTFQVQDDGGTANGGTDLDATPNTMTINVNAVNDPPTANPDTADITEEAPNVAAANTVGGNVLTNDTDPDSVLTVSAVNGVGGNVANPVAGTYGSVTINADGSFTYTLDDTNPTVNALAPLQTLSDQFGYTASDGSLAASSTLTVTIHGADDPPTPDDDAFDFIGNTALEIDCAAGDCNPFGTPAVVAATPGGDPALGVLDGDVDVDGGSVPTITSIVTCGDITPPFDCVLPGQGTVHLEADGSFTFVPEAGDTDPTATFDYVLNNNALDPGTVTLTRFERVWYVDPNAGGGGNGASNAPFNTLDSLDGAGGAGDSDVPGDYVFVHDGTLALSATMEMEASQHLVGQGQVAVTTPSNFALSIPVGLNGNASPTNLVATGAHPQLSFASGNAITATEAIPVEIVGLSLQGSVNAIDLTTDAALAGSATLTMGRNVFRGAGAEGIDVNMLSPGTTGTLTLNILDNSWDLAGTHTGNAVDVNRAAGTLNLDFSRNTGIVSAAGGVSIQAGALGAIRITGFADNSVHGNTGGTAIFVSQAAFDADVVTGGFQQVDANNLAIGDPGNAVGGGGLFLSPVQGNLFFDDLDSYVSNASSTALTVNGTMTFAVTPAAPDGSGTSVLRNAAGPALDVASATIDLRLDDLDSSTSSSGVTLNTVAGQFKTDTDASIVKSSGAGTAFTVGSSSATVDYAGTLNVTSGSGVSLTSNSGSTTFRGGMTLSTGANTAFAASGGGTVNVLDPAGIANNTVTTTTATAVTISGTTIGVSGVTFESVNSTTAGANTTIVLANTGTGAFSVTGIGTTGGSGGTIDNKTVDAITLNNTDGLVTLKNMIIEDIGDMGGAFDTFSTDDAIHAQQVDGGLTLEGVTIRRISDQAIHGATLAGNAATVWNGLTITNSLIENTNRWHVANTADDNNEGMIRILGIRGTVSITGSTLQDGAEMLDFFVTGGTLNMTATSNNFNRAYKEFTSGVIASQGGHCIDVTVQNSSNATIVVGDRNNDALDNNFLNCRIASMRVAADATATGTINVTVGRNDFTVNDHSSGIGGDFDFPQGGLALSSQPTTPDTLVFNAVVDGNYFDEIANASGGVGQLTLAMANGTWQVLVQNNTFDTPGNAPWFVRADSTSSAKVLFQSNVGIKGFFNCPDPSCAGGYDGPGLRSLVDLQNGAVADVTILGDQFAEHDAGFDPGQTFEARNLNTGGGGTLCLDLQNNQAPDGYSLEEFAGDFNLVGSGTCPVGSPSANCQTLLGNRGNRGGSNVATTNPPFVNVEVGSSIDVVAGACQQPSGGIF